MIEHLYAEGYRRIFVLAGINLAYYSRERLLAVMKTMAELGIPLEPDGLWSGNMCVDSGRRAARDFLATGAPLPDAIFCLNDPMAIGVLDVFRQAGIRVPEDVAVAGFDNIEAAEYLSLTTVAVPMREMGRLAARAAIHAVVDQKRADDQTVGVELIVRSSTMRRAVC
jgi:LacI family transcriptional regulator